MYRLRTFGGLSLDSVREPVERRGTQRKALALLALVAAAGEHGISRDKLLAYLWPESDTERARGALRQTLHALRRHTGDTRLVVGAGELRLDPAVLSSDVSDFAAALRDGDRVRAVALYGGPFLDGFYLPDAPEFEQWAEGERMRCAASYVAALEQLARAADAHGDPTASVHWWRQLMMIEPLNGRFAVRLAQSLAASGDGAGALHHIRAYTSLVGEELGAPPAPELLALAERLRHDSSAANDTNVVAAMPPSRDASTDPAPSVNRPAGDGTGEHEEPGAADAIVAPVDALQPVPDRRARRLWALHHSIWAALGAVFVLSAVGSAVSHRARTVRLAGERPDEQVVAVMPFRIGGADSSVGYLREGMGDLLRAKLIGDVRAVNMRTVLSEVHRHASTMRPAAVAAGHEGTAAGGEDLPPDDARAVAWQVGAGRVVLGEVVGRADGQVTVSASLLAVVDARPAWTATVVGPVHAIPTLVDRLAARLFALEAGLGGERLTHLGTIPFPAVRAFLAGQEARRRGRFEMACAHYAKAVRIDSSFALAGLELAYASPLCADQSYLAAGMRSARRGHHRLGAGDRALLDAGLASGDRRDLTGAELIASAERAVQLVPDRVEAWYVLADRLLHLGPALGLANSRGRALEAFERALAMDPTYTPHGDHLVALQVEAGNLEAARRRVAVTLPASAEPLSDVNRARRWIAGMVLGDSVLVQASRMSVSASSSRYAAAVVDWAVESGQGLMDAERALSRERESAATPVQRHNAWFNERMLALARGQPARAARAYGELYPVRTGTTTLELRPAYWAALDAMLGDGDPALGARGRRALEGATYSGEAPMALTVAALYDLAHGDPRTARRAVRLLRTPRSYYRDAQRWPDALALLVDAELAATERRADAWLVLGRLDSALKQAPYPTSDVFLAVGNLIAARGWERAGDVPRALAAIRRRPLNFRQATFHSTYLREEGRLAALAGDREGAVRAYRQYVALRSAAEPALQADAAHARAELARLER